MPKKLPSLFTLIFLNPVVIPPPAKKPERIGDTSKDSLKISIQAA
ncbi:MAG TPA: hypothetical protein VMM58_10975 [Bacteroidota bacterium]|nr:hypothetical protein [Bacteroidota bacterium]